MLVLVHRKYEELFTNLTSKQSFKSKEELQTLSKKTLSLELILHALNNQKSLLTYAYIIF